jgi:hypothetical protein
MGSAGWHVANLRLLMPQNSLQKPNHAAKQAVLILEMLIQTQHTGHVSSGPLGFQT